jgi:hypothetical protein
MLEPKLTPFVENYRIYLDITKNCISHLVLIKNCLSHLFASIHVIPWLAREVVVSSTEPVPTASFALQVEEPRTSLAASIPGLAAGLTAKEEP